LAELETIPTPLNLKWKRLRYQIVPVVVFCVCALATAWLWKDYAGGAQAFGEVTAVTLQVAAPRDGKLIEQTNFPKPLDRVKAGDPLARFDSSALVTQQEKVQDDLSLSQKELDEANKKLEEAQKGGGNKAATDELKARVAGLKTVVAEQRSRFNHLEKQIKESTIEAPVSGTVTEIKHQPNEFVKQGQEIFVITQDSGSYIVSYVRPYGSVVPKKDQKVLLRGQSRKTATSIVQEVGTKLEPIPNHQLGNTSGKKPTAPEWGIPVRIAMPSQELLPLRPGELVSVVFRAGDEQ
jgi:multidrug resistance efflux pump